ncbi:CD276 antigen-like isoform X2 [Thunnus thynnus]
MRQQKVLNYFCQKRKKHSDGLSTWTILHGHPTLKLLVITLMIRMRLDVFLYDAWDMYVHSLRDVPLGSPSPVRSQSGENCCLCVKYFCTDMSSSSLVIVLLCAPIMGQIPVPLNATVGGSVLIPCSLPVNSKGITWFYWQEEQSNNILFHWHTSKITEDIAKDYRNRCQVSNTEFSSGNISIRLNNVSVGDDQKTFWAFVGFDSTKRLERQCKSSLQVSAAYQDLNLTINSTLNSATCTAHGGYPEPEVKWTGQNKSSGEQLKLKDAQTSHQQHPTKKTFSVTSTVSVKELQSVTCLVYNPRSNQQIENTAVIDAPDEELLRDHSTISVSIGSVAAILLLLLLFVCLILYRRRRTSNCLPTANPSSASGGSAGGNASNMQSRSVESADGSEPEMVGLLPGHQSALYRPSVRRDGAAANVTNEDSSASEETDDHKKEADETKTTESDKDK